MRQGKYILVDYICQSEYIGPMVKQATFDMERLYQALGDTTRLRLLNLMGDQELCVCYFVEVLGQPQPKISRHLAYLRNAGIVTARRQGTWMHYRIMTPQHSGAANILRETLAWMKEDRSLQVDRARLTKACCSPAKYPLLDGAPLPITVSEVSCEVC
jgi:ArsR family transcriptional regulator